MLNTDYRSTINKLHEHYSLLFFTVLILKFQIFNKWWFLLTFCFFFLCRLQFPVIPLYFAIPAVNDLVLPLLVNGRPAHHASRRPEHQSTVSSPDDVTGQRSCH